MTAGADRRRVLRLTAAGACVELDASCVMRVVRAGGLLRIPLTEPRVAGLLVADKEVVPVYRLAEIEPAGPAIPPEEAREGTIVVLEEDGALAGFLVERAEFVTLAQGSSAGEDSTKTKHRLMRAAGVTAGGPGAEPSAARAAEGESHRDEEEGIPG